MIKPTRGSMIARTNVTPGRRVFSLALGAGLLAVLALLGTGHGLAKAAGGSPGGAGTGRDAAATVTSIITLPYVANGFTDPRNTRSSIDSYNSRFTITDTGSNVACVTVAYSFIGGNRSPVIDAGPAGSLCPHGYPIAPGSQLTFAPTAGQAVIAMPPATANALMQATVTATGAPVTVDVDAYVTNSAVKTHASYRGLIASSTDATASQLGTHVSLETIEKTVDGYFSQVFIANAGSTAAQVAIRYAAADGTPYSMSLSVPAGGGARYGVYDDDLLPVGFKGSATLTSDQPIGTVVFRGKMTGPGTFAYDDVYSAALGVADPVPPAVVAIAPETSHGTGGFSVSRMVVIIAAAVLGLVGLLAAIAFRRARRRVLLRRQPGEARDLSSMPGMAPRRPSPTQAVPAPSPVVSKDGRPWGRLVVVEGKDAGQTFVLNEDTELVGRARFCSVRLKDQEIAAAHFLVSRDGSVHPSTPGCALEVDGSIARYRPLADGSLIRVGRTCLRFEIP